MRRLIHYLTVGFLSLGYLRLGLVHSGIVVLYLLALWIGALDQLKYEGLPRGRKGWLVWALAYAALMSISIVLNSLQVRDELVVILPSIALFMYLMTDSSPDNDAWGNAFVLFALVQSLIALSQVIFTGVFDGFFAERLGQVSLQNYHFAAGRLTGIWLEAPRLGTMLGMAFPMVLERAIARDRLARFSLPLVVGVLTLTFSRAALASMLVSFVVTLWVRQDVLLAKRLLPVAVSLFVLIGVLQVPQVASVFERVTNAASYTAEFDSRVGAYNRASIALSTVSLLTKHPLFGAGAAYQGSLLRGFTSVHNSYLQSALQFGLPSTIMFFCGIGIALWRAIDRGFRSASTPGVAWALGALCVLMNGAVHGVVFDAFPNLSLWACAGLAVALMTGGGRSSTRRGAQR